MFYTISDALQSLKPSSKYQWVGSEYSGLNWLDTGTAPTESELTTEVTRLTNAEPMRLLRVERDRLLAKTDWRASSDLTLSTAWKTYRQNLRDLPATASPKLDANGNLDMSSVSFPTEPS
tara:strand:- start:1398 stop:1757 length:360 start_codon:yes stop_codon:yes gene_type:complete